MRAIHLMEPQENDAQLSLWREGDGWFSITLDGQTVQLAPHTAEEVANAILGSIMREGRAA